jgi:hypothetical protein
LTLKKMDHVAITVSESDKTGQQREVEWRTRSLNRLKVLQVYY